MIPNRSRTTGIALASAMVVAGLWSGGAALAADDPEGAVEAFFEMAASGDFSDIETIVCAADRGPMREAFDFAFQLGIDDASLSDLLSIEISDRSVEVVSQDGDTATVAARATVAMSVPDDEVDSLVRAILEAEQGPDDPPVSDEDIDRMAGFMGSALNQVMPLDEEVTVVREDGSWLVCGGLVDEPDSGFEPTVSSEGMCAIATPAELSELSGHDYDSANGFAEFCTYSTSDFERFHSASISLSLNQDLEQMAQIFGADQEVQVADAPAFATGAESFGNQLLVQVGEDLLQISITDDEDADDDWLEEATAVAELVLPRVPAVREAIAGPTPAPTPVPTPELSLCEGLSLDELNASTGIGIDDVQGDRYYCGYNQIDGLPGWHSLALSLSELPLDQYRTWLTEAADGTIAGQPALLDETQIVVELPGGAWTLSIAGWIDANDGSVSLTTAELLQMVAEMVVPTVAVPEPTISDIPDPVDGPGTATDQDATPLCDYVDLDAINALDILDFDEVAGADASTCSINRNDLERGFATVAIGSGMGEFDELRSFFPDAQELDVAGRSGFSNGSELYVDSPVGVLAMFAFIPGEDVPDGGTVSEVLLPIAELVLAAMETMSD